MSLRISTMFIVVNEFVLYYFGIAADQFINILTFLFGKLFLQSNNK